MNDKRQCGFNSIVQHPHHRFREPELHAIVQVVNDAERDLADDLVHEAEKRPDEEHDHARRQRRHWLEAGEYLLRF
jgi:hypothetical protein